MRIYLETVLETDADGFTALFIAKKGRIKYMCFPQSGGRHASVRMGTAQYASLLKGGLNIDSIAKCPLDGLYYMGTLIEEKYMQVKEVRINCIEFPISHIYRKKKEAE